MPRQATLPDGMQKRGDTYYARFRAGGRLVRKKLSSDLKVAKELLTNLRARADRADFGILDNDHPWDELKAEFLRWAKQDVRNPVDYEKALNRFETYCPVRSIRQITPEYVMGYREWRLSQNAHDDERHRNSTRIRHRISPRTVNLEVGTLRNMLNKGVEWKRIGFNPIASVKPLRHDKLAKERRALDLEEVQALFDASPEYLKPVWRMFMTSGLRLGELTSLEFSDVDFERRALTVRAENSKSHKPREIPLDRGMLEEIRRLELAARDREPVPGHTVMQTKQQAANFSRKHVFVTKVNTPLRNNLLTRFYAICKRAEIEGAEPGGSVDIHSLRVSFTTLAIDNGASPKAIQAILGHSSLSLTMGVYAKATEVAKRDAVSALPFAQADSPDHVVSLENVRKARATNSNKAQPVAASTG